MAEFEPETWMELLGNLVPCPVSQLDESLQGLVVKFRKSAPAKPPAVTVWNFYKYLLDMIVHTSGGSSFLMNVIDLEPFYTAPEGAFLQSDGSIKNAPWRSDIKYEFVWPVVN